MTEEDFPWPPKTFAKVKKLIASILWDLKIAGDIEHPNAARELWERLSRRGCDDCLPGTITGLSSALTEMETGRYAEMVGPLIRREISVGGKRTKAIYLTATRLPDNPFEEPQEGSGLESVKEPIVSFVVDDGEDIIDGLLALQAALSSVTLRVAQQGLRKSGDERTEVRLANALEEAQRLRKKADAAEETAHAHADTIRALQGRVRILEANVQALAHGEKAQGDYGRQKLDQLMREPPRSGH